MTGWQPIETAPRDGTVVILFNADQRLVDAGHWTPYEHCFEVSLGDWWYTGDCTHWMPLPPAPDRLQGEDEAA